MVRSLPMNLNNIKTIIKNVITGEISSKSILIDGAWGCGKTTILKNAINDLEKDDKLPKLKLFINHYLALKI